MPRKPAHPRLFACGLLCLLTASASDAEDRRAAVPAVDGGTAIDPAGPQLPPDPLGKPALWSGIGDSSLPITTRSPEAQRYFDQGLNLMHGYWSFEARRAFQQAIRLDPEAPMPYWGLFMSTTFNLGEHRADRGWARVRMEQLRSRGDARERGLIDAILRLGRRGEGGGPSGFIEEMDGLIARHPADAEIKLILIKFLVEVSTRERRAAGGSGAGQRGHEMLRELLSEHPDSMAANHYWIHSNEYGPNPAAALASAEILPSLAPNNSHILHMPGHVYFLIGDYARAREAFLASLRVDRRYHAKTGIDAADNWNYSHNLDYLVANCAEDGRYREGLRWAEAAQRLPPTAHSPHSTGLGFILYSALTAPARLHMRYGAYLAAAEDLEQVLDAGELSSSLATQYLRALALYSRGMAAVDGELAAGRRARSELDRIAAQLRDERIEAGADWYFSHAQSIVQVAAAELGGTLLSLAGQHDEAMAALRRAVEMETALGYYEPPHYWRPVHESLAAAQLRAGRPAAARAAFEQVLELRPGSGHAWSGIVRSYIAEGRSEDAREAIEHLREAWRHADPELEQLREIEAWVAAGSPAEAGRSPD